MMNAIVRLAYERPVNFAWSCYWQPGQVYCSGVGLADEQFVGCIIKTHRGVIASLYIFQYARIGRRDTSERCYNSPATGTDDRTTKRSGGGEGLRRERARVLLRHGLIIDKAGPEVPPGWGGVGRTSATERSFYSINRR